MTNTNGASAKMADVVCAKNFGVEVGMSSFMLKLADARRLSQTLAGGGFSSLTLFGPEALV
jgi:hypothetical protein